MPDICDVELIEQGLDLVLAFLLRDPERLKDRQDILLNSQLAKHRRFLRQIAYAVSRPQIHRQPRDILGIEVNAALIRPYETDYHVKDSGLARAIRPEQADNLSLTYLHRYIVDDRPLTIGFSQPFSAEQTRLLILLFVDVGLRLVGAVRWRFGKRDSVSYVPHLLLLLHLLLHAMYRSNATRAMLIINRDLIIATIESQF